MHVMIYSDQLIVKSSLLELSFDFVFENKSLRRGSVKISSVFFHARTESARESLLKEGGVEKKLHQQPQKKKGWRKRQCPRNARGLPQTLEPGPSSRFQLPRPFERLPLCFLNAFSQGFSPPAHCEKGKLAVEPDEQQALTYLNRERKVF